MRPPLKDQIKQAEKAAAEHPELKDVITVHLVALKSRQKLAGREAEVFGLELDQEALFHLESLALKSNTPISHHLEPRNIDQKLLSSTLHSFWKELGQQKRGEVFAQLLNLLKAERLDWGELLKAALKNDIDPFNNRCRELNIDVTSLFLSFSFLIQPLLEEVARGLTTLVEQWWRGNCPVCGRLPTVAKVKKGDRRRYLVCSLCGAEYLIDLFYCPYCENTDSHRLKFMSFEQVPGFSLDICEVCHHYLKVIDENRLISDIPGGMEDILTLPLDVIALEQGLIRD